MDVDDALRLLLEKKIAKFRPFGMCMKLSRKLFQKAPLLIDDLNTTLSSIPPSRSSQRLWHSHQFIQKRILAAIAEKENHGLPKKLENYLAFLDLTWISLTKDDPATTYNWHTFVLQDYDVNSIADSPIPKMRKRLKHFLPETKLASVQMEVEEIDNIVSQVCFRVALVNKTKRGSNDEKNLMKKPGTFLVFFPREPYFYSNKPEPEPLICQAFCSTVNSSGYVPLPLNGPHLESLRQLRLRRDQRCEGKLTSETERDLADKILQSSIEETEIVSKPPVLNKLTLLCSAEFQGNQVLKSYHVNRNWPTKVKNIDMELTFTGRDFLGSLKNLARDEKSNVIEEPFPNWVDRAVNRGRNVIKLTCTNPENENSQTQDENNEAASVCGSEMTVLLNK